MKTTIILLLVLSLLVVSGCSTDVDIKEDITQPTEITEEETIQEIDNSLVEEEDYIEIGEMI